MTRKVQCVRNFGREKKAAKYCMLVKNGRVFKEDLIRAWKHNQHLKYTAKLSYQRQARGQAWEDHEDRGDIALRG